MAHALGISRLDLYLQFDRPLQGTELDTVRELIRERATDKPVAYLLGEWEFRSLSFQVDERVLVPRPETELLVERAIRHLEPLDAPVLADIGTGSGCIAVSVLHALPAARCVATDTSVGAVEVATANAERHGMSDRLRVLAGSLFGPVQEPLLDAVLSNPPYIVRGDASVQAGVDAHEPHEALYVPGDDPLEVFRAIAEAGLERLRSGGLLAMEVGFGAADAAAALLGELGYADVETTQDLAGIDRVVSAIR